MIKYIGSKRVLLPHIVGLFSDLAPGTTVLDLFSGTSRVAQALKQMGLSVQANDHNAYAATIARCYIEADADLHLGPATDLIAALQDTGPAPAWFTRHYAEEARFFHPDNAARIEAIRNRIEALDLSEPLRAIALVSLMEAADRVDSTTGVQMAYLKQWAARATKPLALRVPDLLPGTGRVSQSEAVDAATAFSGTAAYLDPPYNQHSYRANYHVWETLVRWDDPEVYGVARKREDCRTRKSDFNSKRRIEGAFRSVIDALDVDRLVVSFNNEGFLDTDTIQTILSDRGAVHAISVDHKRYVGAQIGIHNPAGKKVGQVGHLRNKEWFFLVDADPDIGSALAKSVANPS